MAAGLDVGTSYLVLARQIENNELKYNQLRDAYYVIKPTTPVAAKMVEKGLQNKIFIKSDDNTFILLGQDAIQAAIERNDVAKRPMYRGVVSSKDKAAKKVLAFLLKEVVGAPVTENEKLVFCVPAQPIDQEDEDFDVGYHEDVVKTVLSEVGYDAKSIKEAEALCYSELESEDFTGIAVSCGAGMVNVCIMLNGEPVVNFATTKSGDWIDRMSAVATGENDTAVQAEKENGEFVIGNTNENPILEAVSSYYLRLIDYTTKQIAAAMEECHALPKFQTPLKVVISGGTSKAKGFVEVFHNKLVDNGFPLPVKEVVHAQQPLLAVSKGCLIASQIL